MAIGLFTSTALAQSGITIQLDGEGANLAGGEHAINLYGTHPEMDGGVYNVHFIVNNYTGSDKQLKITAKEMSVPSSWGIDQICWPPQCYNATEIGRAHV